MSPADDIIRSHGTFLQMTSPEIYSRRFSEFIRHFHSHDYTDTSQLRRRLKYTTTFKGEMARLNKRREDRPAALEPSKRQRRKMFRVGSEPSLFPPISDIGHSLPLTSSLPAVQSNSTSPLGLKEDLLSHLQKRETQKSRTTNALTVDTKSQEVLRLSPIAFSDRKIKTDGKLEKHITLTPRGSIPKINSKTSLVESQRNNERSNSLESHNKTEKADKHHRSRGKGKHSKSKSNEEPFSVRRKIEQYRRWHEEQYLQKLQRLKQDPDNAEDDHLKQDPDSAEDDHLKHDNDSVEDDHLKEEMDSSKVEKVQATIVKPQKQIMKTMEDENNNITRNTLEPIVIPDSSVLRRSNRQKSACTWKTWRNVNESDAYSDVKKYIEDNELMNSEKESWIKAWICEVEKARYTSEPVSESESV